MTGVLGRERGDLPAAEPITISALEFDVLWEHLRLAEMPLVLRVPSPGRTYTERRELVAHVRGHGANVAVCTASQRSVISEVRHCVSRPFGLCRRCHFDLRDRAGSF